MPDRPRLLHPLSLADLLETVFKGHPLEKRIHEGRIWQVWNEAVGEKIASRAQPVKLANGILTVAVSSPSWMQQLGFLKKEIVAKINDLAGEQLVSDLFLKAGSLRSPSSLPSPKRKPPRRLTSEEETWIAEETGGLDADLAGAFTSLMRRHLADRD